MNRIILIGNGFDLAHGMKTSYRDFIDDYWKTLREDIEKNKIKQIGANNYENEHKCVRIEIPYTPPLGNLANNILKFQSAYNGIIYGKITFYNKFLEQICNHVSEKNWVDIENKYYEGLKHTIGLPDDECLTLNNEFEVIEKLLEEYLTGLDEERISNKKINEKIYSSVKGNDIPLSYINKFIQEIERKTRKGYIDNHERYKNQYRDCGISYTGNSDFEEFSSDYKSKESLPDLKKQLFNGSIPHYFAAPNDILFLNFNYTHTHQQYIPKESGFDTIHIHGELNNPNNPIIFGYGDELAEDYKQIENLNNNEYLKNVKSIRYLETSNYRRLLSFIESEPYQIFIMGHSCGNSDRTLLNTLFEHKNCVSIKPFFHQRDDGSDNYSDIVRNISRNFTDKALMRERVVNKMYCEPLT